MSLPLLALPRNTVLFPGTVLRVPFSNDRADVAAILSAVYKQAAENASTARPSSVHIACVPLRPRGLIRNGQKITPQDDVTHVEERLDIDPSKAKEDDLFGFGVAARVIGVEGLTAGSGALVVEGISRIRIMRYTHKKPMLEVEVAYEYDTVQVEDLAIQRLFSQLKELSQEVIAIIRLTSLLPGSTGPLFGQRLEAYISRRSVEEAGVFADFLVNSVADAAFEERLQFLATVDVPRRLERAVDLLQRQVDKFKKNVKFTTFTSTNAPRNEQKRLTNSRGQRSLLPPLSGLPSAPGNSEELDELKELKKSLDTAKLTPEASKIAQRDLKRLSKMSPMQAEYQVIRNYLEVLAEIPWSTTTEDQLGVDTLAKARQQLDDDHYGLEKVKKRLIEYLAVLRLKQSINNGVQVELDKAKENNADEKLEILQAKRMIDKSPILLLLGPPGVGKTSLAKSVATALGRKFHRISLGGVRDEAEIRGHRRTYVASKEGQLIHGLKKVGVKNPVFLLDELDKLGTSNFHGDPSAAMLEALDPEQNRWFTDHYLNIPFDLSQVLFIATANNIDTIPPPLLDRLEIIKLPGYTLLEKKTIAQRHLIPKQIRTNGLGDGQVEFGEGVVSTIIESYTREAGVRTLEREVGSVCRAKAVQYAEARDAGQAERYKAQVTVEDLEDILGIENYDAEITENTSHPGIVTGLVASDVGGGILFIEASDMPGDGKVQLTGKLGDVLKESVEVALSWVRKNAYALGLATHDEDIMRNRNVHVHCPAGATPKDGPSAGVAHTLALISLFSNHAIPPKLAMTGEISLRGRVTAVGGIKEKLIGALRAGVKTVMLPAQNRKDAKDLPQEVKDGLEIVYIRHIWEAIKVAWPGTHWPGEQLGIESQL